MEKKTQTLTNDTITVVDFHDMGCDFPSMNVILNNRYVFWAVFKILLTSLHPMSTAYYIITDNIDTD